MREATRPFFGKAQGHDQSRVPGPVRQWLRLIPLILLSACASHPLPSSSLPQAYRLEAPHWPPDDRSCGPIALASALRASGVEVTPDALAPQLYLPGRGGSLQIEMQAAARQQGRMAWTLDGPKDLIPALQQGYPVLVLLNLGLTAAPIWHYALVTGWQQAGQQLSLQGFEQPHQTRDWSRFQRQWQRAEYWAIVLSAFEAPPLFLGSESLSLQLADLESLIPDQTERAYRAMIHAWPRQSLPRFGLANSLRQQKRHAEAVEVLEEMNPATHPAIANNLALSWAELGQSDKALALLLQSLSGLPPNSPWQATLQDSLYRIAKAP